VNRKIPPDAFTYYASLGPKRSYQAVAEHYTVSKRAVTGLADREKWQERLMEIERKARDKADEKVLETLEEMNVRHLKVLRFIQNKSIEALKSMPIDSAMDAVRAFGLCLDKERTIRGEPSDHSQVDIAQVTRDEMRRLLTTDPVGTNGPDDW
jgi:hypothetical protein